MLYVHNEGMRTFDLLGLILCESGGVLSQMLCTHNVGIGSFDLHVVLLCVSEGVLSQLLYVHIKGMGTFDLHALILCESGGVLSELLVFTMRAWDLLTFVDRFYMYSLQVALYSHSGHGLGSFDLCGCKH